MFSSPYSRRRSAPVRRSMLALAAAFCLLLQQTVVTVTLAQTARRQAPAPVIEPPPPSPLNNTAQTLPFSQNWSNIGLITTNDDWSGVPGIEGYRGDGLTGGTGVDPQTVTASDTPGVLDVNANQTNPNTFTTGGVTEFHITDPVVALQGSGTARAPYLLINLNTTGQSNINVAYNLRDVDGSTDNSVQPVALQFRVGNTGTYTNVPAGFVADASSGPSLATLVTPVSATLPASANNQSLVQVRIITTDAVGNDEWIGVDDINVTAGGGGGGSTISINDVSMDEGSGGGLTSFNFTVSLTPANATQTVTVDFTSANNTAISTGEECAVDDYFALRPGTLTFNPNETTKQITVGVCADSTPEPNETFFVNLSNATNATISDPQGVGTIQNDDVTITPIHDIQGSGTASPFPNGTSVTTTGIVTGRKTNGFFIQEPDATVDSDPNTSEAIFVFTSSAPSSAIAVGDSVRVTGTVMEFEPATTEDPNGVSPPDPKTATELTGPTTVVLSSGNPLPTALDADSLNIFNPAATSRGAELEKYEFMRVSVASLTVGQPTNAFGEFWGVETGTPRPFREPGIERGDPIPAADEGPHAGSPPPNVPVWDGNFERIMVDSDDATSTANARRTSVVVTFGAVVTGLVGPLDFVHINGTGNYRVMLDFTATPGVTPGITEAVPVPTPTAQEFTIAHTNLENFSSSNATKLNKASLAVRNVLHTPDVLGLIEVDTAASAQALADKINMDAGGNPAVVNYVAYFNDIAGSTQDLGYLVNTARVSVNGSATPYHQGDTFTYCGTTATLHDRPSLILSVNAPQAGGGTLPVTVVLNHLRSLIGVDSPAPVGTCGTGTEGARVREKRRLQAEDVADLIQSRSSENLVVLGDFNAFDFNDGLADVMGTLKGSPVPPEQVVEPSTDRWTYQLTNLLVKLPASEHYSLLFEGNAQALDHVLVNNQMLARNSRFAYGRFNADFSASFASDPSRPERVADHDSPVAYFTTGVPQAPGSVIISEYRLRGPGFAPPGENPGRGGTRPRPGGRVSPAVPAATPASLLPPDNDEFIEFYNNTDSPITVQTTDGSAGWSLVASDGVARFTIPNGAVIPARGHYLATNSLGYSLTNYPGGNDGMTETFSAGDIEYSLDIPGQSGIALFNSANPANFLEANRLDAVGYTTNPALYREGAGFQAGEPGAEIGGNIEYSFLRDLTAGTPKDTQDNVADFRPVETSGQNTSIGQRLGAPGPENRFAPVLRNAVNVDRLDKSVGTNVAPNRVRSMTPVTNGANGTIAIRRNVINLTGQPVTRLRFRIKEVTTFPSPPGTADVRALSSEDVQVMLNDGSTVMVQGTILEEPPLQPNGGGWNTSWSPSGTINLESPLPAGSSINVQFVLGVQQNGSFRIFINVEALP